MLQLLASAPVEGKRRSNANYAAVGFTYDRKEKSLSAPPTEPHPLPVAGPALPEHPPTSSVDFTTEGDKGRFAPPVGLPIPESMQVVRITDFIMP